MRKTVVPAQVTTVEDKITGNLGLSQLVLLVLPVFGGSALFVVLPPFFSYATYKVVLIVCFAVLCATLAIRIKGKILLMWLVVILKYNLRPRYYIIDRKSSYLREEAAPIELEANKEDMENKPVRTFNPRLAVHELVEVEKLLTNPDANLQLRTNRKGELSVHFTEIK